MFSFTMTQCLSRGKNITTPFCCYKKKIYNNDETFHTVKIDCTGKEVQLRKGLREQGSHVEKHPLIHGKTDITE